MNLKISKKKAMRQLEQIYTPLISAIFIIFLLFCFIGFSLNEVDSFWIYSWATLLADQGLRTDAFFRPDDTAAGTQLFHLIPTFIISIVYELAGHGYHVIIVSNLLWSAALAAALYYHIKQNSKTSPKEITIFILIVCAMEPVVRSVISLRPEIISIVLTYTGLVLMQRRHRLVPGVLSVLAIEAHITGIVGFLFILIKFIQDQAAEPYRLENYSKLFFGFMLGSLAYVLMHIEMLTFVWVEDLLQRREISSGHSPFMSYFWHAKFKRHLPELALIVLALILIVRTIRFANITPHQKNLIIQIFTGFCVIELLGRGNYLYVIWWMLPFYLFCLTINRRLLVPLLIFHLISYVLAFTYKGNYNHLGLAMEVRRFSDNADFVMGPGSILPGTAIPSQFIHLASGADINPKHLTSDVNILVVSRDLHTNMFLVGEYYNYYIGWYTPQSSIENVRPIDRKKNN